MAENEGKKSVLGRIGEAALTVAKAADDAVRGAANAIVPADMIAGAANGIIQTVTKGGSLRENVSAAIAKEEGASQYAQANGHAYNVGTAVGVTANVATGGLGAAAKAANTVASVNTVKLAYSVHETVGGVTNAAQAATSSYVQLGEMSAPCTPKAASGQTKCSARG